MNIRTSQYPVFVPNQVLSAGKLNDIIAFLDGEQRFTRSHLIGTGIACGLQIDLQGSEIIIYSGFGISSDGFILELGCSAGVNDTRFRYYKTYEDSSPNSPWVDGMGTALTGVHELTNDADSGAPNFDPHDPVGNLPDTAVIVLYLECTDEDLDNCTTGDCDDLGVQRNFRVVPLAVEAGAWTTLSKSISESPEPATLIRFVPRRIFNGTPLGSGQPPVPTTENPIAEITSASHLESIYNDIVADSDFGFPAFKDAITAAGAVYGNILRLSAAEADEISGAGGILDQVDTIQASALFPAQVKYDLLWDLSLAMDEFLDFAWYYANQCCTDVEAHPKYLMLGTIDPGVDPDIREWRHFWKEAPTYDGADFKFRKLRMLYKRMVRMVQSFGIPDLSTGNRIVPSRKTPSPLGMRSMPYYYDGVDTYTLKKYWNPDWGLRQIENQKITTFMEYHLNAPTEENKTPSLFNMGEYPFYRIEGHLGRPVAEVLTTLNNQRKLINFEFSLVALAASNTATITDYREVCKDTSFYTQYLTTREAMLSLISLLQDYFRRFETGDFLCYQEFYNSLIKDMPAVNGETFTPVTYSDGLTATILQELDTALQDVLGALPPDFDDLDFSDFIGKYNEAARKAIATKLKIRKLIFDLAYDRIYYLSSPAYFYITHFLGEPLRYLDLLIDDTIYLQLARVHYQFQADTNSITSSVHLSGFASKNYGLDHRAGVNPGGTFVVVYDDTTADHPVVADFSLENACCEECIPVEPVAVSLPPLGKPIYNEVNLGGTITFELTQMVNDDPTSPTWTSTDDVPSGSCVADKGIMEVDPGNTGTDGYDRYKYVASSDPIYRHLADKYDVGQEDAAAGVTIYTTVFTFLKSNCVPMLYAKDLVVTTDNKSDLDIYLGASALFSGVTIAPVTIENTRGTIALGTTSDLVYTPPAGFEGVDTFRYSLTKDGEIAFGNIRVLVTKCCGSTDPIPDPTAEYHVLTDDSMQSIPLSGDAFLDPNVDLVRVYGENKGLGIANFDNSSKTISYAPIWSSFSGSTGDTFFYTLRNRVTGAETTGSVTIFPSQVAGTTTTESPTTPPPSSPTFADVAQDYYTQVDSANTSTGDMQAELDGISGEAGVGADLRTELTSLETALSDMVTNMGTALSDALELRTLAVNAYNAGEGLPSGSTTTARASLDTVLLGDVVTVRAKYDSALNAANVQGDVPTIVATLEGQDANLEAMETTLSAANDYLVQLKNLEDPV